MNEYIFVNISGGVEAHNIILAGCWNFFDFVKEAGKDVDAGHCDEE